MKWALRICLSVLLFAITTAAQQRLEAPSTVYIVTGAQTTALYHRDGCDWLRSGPLTPMALAEAQKRYFQPHCLCIAGKDGKPPCEATTVPVTSAAGSTTAAAVATTPASSAPSSVASNATETVYVTRTGEKYHRAGCRSLSRSQIPMTLKEASARYGACANCRPPVLTTSPATAASTPTAEVPVERATTPAPSRAPSSGQCQAITKKGTRCSRQAQPGRSFCWQH
jgi:hypothetical protein